MKNTLLLTTLLAMQSVSASSVMIDLDLGTPGVQNSITDAVEGQVVNFALVVTNFTGDIHCFNGIGGDISSKGTMTVAYDASVQAGTLADYTNEAFVRDVMNGSPKSPGSALQQLGLPALDTYTNNVGGVGFKDQGSNLNGDNHVVSFTNVPGGSVAYATIFTSSMTLTNVAGNTLNLFPSGVFNNPPVQMGPNGEALLSNQPFSFQQDGEIMLHTELHTYDNQCMGIGSGDLIGASITGVPEPSSSALLGLGVIGLIFRRNRV